MPVAGLVCFDHHVTGHPTMPEFRLDPGQVNDVISYLKSLER